ncbi:MAG: O-antigen ligase family protein [Bacillota bacterium]
MLANSLIFLLSFTVPVIGLSFVISGFEITITEAVALFVLLGGILSLLFKVLFSPGKSAVLRQPLLFPFAAFLAANFLSLLNHPDPLSGVYYIIRWILFAYICYVLVPANLIDNHKRLKVAIYGLSLSSLIVAISGWLSLVGQDINDKFFRVGTISFWGTQPFGSNHNLIAEFLVVGSYFWLAIKELSLNERYRRACTVVYLFITAAAVLTFSRAAWISLAIQAVFYLLIKYRNSLKRQEGLILLIGLGITIVMIPVFLRMAKLQEENISSTENRIILSEIAYQAWKDHPLIGNGAGRFTDFVASNIRFTAKYGDPIDSHGFLQKILLEGGVTGLLAWLFLLAAIARKAYLAIENFGYKAPWLLPLWTSALGVMIFQIFNTSYYKGKTWLPIAIALIATYLAEKRYGKA